MGDDVNGGFWCLVCVLCEKVSGFGFSCWANGCCAASRIVVDVVNSCREVKMLVIVAVNGYDV